MPYLAFAVFLIVNKIANHDITPFYIYAIVIIAMIVGDIASKGNPARQLLIFSVMGITAINYRNATSGMVSVLCIYKCWVILLNTYGLAFLR